MKYTTMVLVVLVVLVVVVVVVLVAVQRDLFIYPELSLHWGKDQGGVDIY